MKYCPLLQHKTQKMTLNCKYKGELDFNALNTIERCIHCLVIHKRYINNCLFFILKDLRKKRNKKILTD